MSSRNWNELETFDGKTYLVQYLEVDTHEGFTIHSRYTLREATKKDIKEYESKREYYFEE